MWLHSKFAGALLISAVLPPAVVSPPATGITIQVESLGLRFEAPDKWRLSRASTPEQLIFYPGKTKTSPVLRVCAFQGNLSPEDRLTAMTRGLPVEEASVHFVSSQKWSHEGRRYETATLAHKKGTQEWHGSFTLVSQPRKVQHGFWLFGRKKDIQQHWEGVRASVVTAKVIRRVGSQADEPQGPEHEAPEKAEAVWSDSKSGLRVGSWPAGFAPEKITLKQLTKRGVRLLPVDDKIHKSTAFLLTGIPGAEENAANDAAAELHTGLEAKSTVIDLRRLPVRVGGLEAALIKWTEERAADTLVHQVHFVQKGEIWFRIEFTAEERWARARSRRSLVKDFIASISFE